MLRGCATAASGQVCTVFPLYPYYNPNRAFWPDFQRNVLFAAKKTGFFNPFPKKI